MCVIAEKITTETITTEPEDIKVENIQNSNGSELLPYFQVSLP